MTSTLARLTDPTVPLKAWAGSSLYTPGSGVIGSVRHAIVANTRPWDAYIAFGLNDMTVESNILVPSVLIPAYKSVVVPLDVIVANADSDVLKARQSIGYTDQYGTASLLQTPAVVTNGTGNNSAATTVATGSWTEVNGTLYMLTVAWKKAGGAGTLDSFTDTHAGITWTLIKQITSADGTQKLAVYVGVSTGTTATTTTANFSASQDKSAIAVTNVALTGTFDDANANGTEGLILYGYGEDARSTTTPYIALQGRPSYSNRLYSFTCSGAAAVAASSGWTELNDITTNLTMETAYMLGTGTGQPGVVQPTVTAGNPNLAIAVEVQQDVQPLAVTLYGVEVT